MAEVKLPEIGEGIESGDVLEVLVQEGDVVKKGQGIVELETDKATIVVDSTHEGKISKIHVSEGDTVKIGQAILSVEAEDGAEAKEDKKEKPAEEKAEAPDEEGDGKKKPEAKQKQEAAEEEAEEAEEEAAEPVAKKHEPEKKEDPQRRHPPSDREREEREAPARPQAAHSLGETAGGGGAIPASPSVRRFAREVGVTLADVTGTGEGGRITREDVLEAVRRASQLHRENGGAKTARAAATKPIEAPEVTPPGEASKDNWGPVRVEKMPRIRRTIAERMHQSWSTIPRVTNFDDADVTELEKIRQASKADYAAAGVKLTSMPFVIKAVAQALRANPRINATVDLESGQVIYKQYYNVGVAVDTERGLVVPSLRDADELSISEIARELSALAERVRSGKFEVKDTQGSTFTI
ncbi:MAG: 2-oxo acid dehydrogenase subunit E2, partial [Planctomycetes bacterium]|nr:2-oxo acid dehydrogenase subunit E2 [Planctomycetota bacterium]